jgi:hypothetical protein
MMVGMKMNKGKMKMYNYDNFADWLQSRYPDVYQKWCEDDNPWCSLEPQEYVKDHDFMVFREWVAEQEVDHCH